MLSYFLKTTIPDGVGWVDGWVGELRNKTKLQPSSVWLELGKKNKSRLFYKIFVFKSILKNIL